jgi:lysyl-tRNA synthetase class 2
VFARLQALSTPDGLRGGNEPGFGAFIALMETPESPAIRAIRYDEDRARLLVRFIDGGEYAFVGVPGEVHRSFVAAESKGRFFAEKIRGRYPYNKLTQ